MPSNDPEQFILNLPPNTLLSEMSLVNAKYFYVQNIMMFSHLRRVFLIHQRLEALQVRDILFESFVFSPITDINCRNTILALGSFLDTFQKIADAATNTKGE